MSALAEQAILREARRILRKLAGGALLKALPDGRYGVASRRAKAEGARLRVGASDVAAMQSRGLIAPEADGYVLTEAGRAFLDRSGAPEDPFLAQHRTIETREVEKDGARVRVAVNIAESPLAMLRRRGLVGAESFAAGERLRRDFTMAQLTPRMGVDWSAPCVFGRRAAKPDQLSETVLAAKQRFRNAMLAAGPDLSGLLFDVCCDLCGLEESERRRGWPRASAKVVLNIALNRLAQHYGIGETVMHAPTRGWIKEENPRREA